MCILTAHILCLFMCITLSAQTVRNMCPIMLLNRNVTSIILGWILFFLDAVASLALGHDCHSVGKAQNQVRDAFKNKLKSLKVAK